MARRKTGDKKVTGREVDIPKVQADDHSIAFEELHVGGNVGGDIRIGHTIGYTADQVSVLLKQITTTLQPKKFDGRCPYKGLEVFEEEDAELFFGRERLVDELVGRVKESRTVFITGPSGSGKSSLVRAGLIHALKQGAIKSSDRWLYETMKPGREPLKDLALAFSRLKSPELEDYFLAHTSETEILNKCAESVLRGRKDQRFVLFVDQFEEVFTQINSEEERVAFINMLAYAGTVENGRVTVLFAMRSDFVSNCATYPALNELLSQEFRQIGAMQPEELVSAIALPARHVGLPVEHELIAQIINDMRGEPDALPLMQFALKDLFDAKQAAGGVIALTLKDYLQHGGIHKSLERHADATFAKLSEREQELTRSIFSGLIEIGRGRQDTKRTALFDELIPANAKAEDVLTIVQKLADARLVITDEQAGKDTVTISHEKLIEAWPWLKKLVNENREVIALQNEIASDAKEWEDHKRDVSYLYTGGRLANVREQLEAKKLVLSGLAQSFIEVSVKAHTDELEAANQRAVQLRRQARNLTVALIAALIAVSAAVFFGFQSQQQAKIAQSNADEAHQQAQFALARQLVVQAQSLSATGNSEQMLAILLAIQSIRIFPSVEAAQILQNNSLAYPIVTFTHADSVSSVVYSPDGKYIASGSLDKTARVWLVATGKEIARVTHDNYVSAVAFSPNGKYVVSGSRDGTARVWEATTGNEVARMIHGASVSTIAFSPDGKYIVSAGCDKRETAYHCIQGSARIWEVATSKEIAHMAYDGINSDDDVTSVAFSPDGKYVVSGSYDKTARVWEATTGREISRVTHDTGVITVAFSPNGKYVVSGCAKTVWVWNATTGTKISHIDHDYGLSKVDFSPDGKYLISAAYDGTARVWETITGKEVTRMMFNDWVLSATFSPNGKYVAAGSENNTALIWEAVTGKKILEINHNKGVTAIAFSPNGNYVASGSQDNTVVVWRATSKDLSRLIPMDDISLVAFSQNGKYIAVSNRDKGARVWDALTGQEIASIAYDTEVSSISFSPDGKYIVLSSCDSRNANNSCIEGSVQLWDATMGQEIIRMKSSGNVESVIFSPDGKYVISVNRDNTVSVWEPTEGKEIVHKKYAGFIKDLALSFDGKYAVVANLDNTAIIWEVSTGKEVARLIHDRLIGSVAFSPDGKFLVSASWDNTVHIWKISTGKEVARLTHDGHVESVAFSPDGKYIVSASTDNTTRVWEVASRKEVSQKIYDHQLIYMAAFSPDSKFVITNECIKYDQLGGCNQGAAHVWNATTGQEVSSVIHKSEIVTAVFSPDGKYVFTVGYDGTPKLWMYNPKFLIDDACSRVTRNLNRSEWNKYIGDILHYQATCANLSIEPEPTPTAAP